MGRRFRPAAAGLLRAVLLGAVSLIVGVAVGTILSLVLIYVINIQSFNWTIQYHFPWIFLAQASAGILAATGLATPNSRVVLEKPRGRDLASAKQINLDVGKVFAESQIYRIDHYLGKETAEPAGPALREYPVRAAVAPRMDFGRADHHRRSSRR